MKFTAKFLHKKTQKVIGRIISWVDSPEGNFPIISFRTLEGREISGVLTRNEILSLEAMPLTDRRKRELKSNLPFEGMIVEYDIAKPYIFTANYA